MPSHADTISAALRERVAGIATSVGNAGRCFTRAAQAVSGVSDVEEVMRAAVEVVVAAEALHKLLKDTVLAELRAALAEAIESSGCPAVRTEHHTAYLQRQQAFLSIADEARIPREYYVQPPVALDRRALKSALADGLEVPGASLATPNARTLAIRTRNEETTP
jgi:hypothetical protein